MQSPLLSQSKRAFTLVELLVVVAIIGILSVGISGIDFNGMSSRQKRDRFANGIVSLFRNEITKNSTGKAIRSGTTFTFPTKTLIVLDRTEIRTEYYSGSTLQNKDVFSTAPFYGEDKYDLVSATGSSIGNLDMPLSFSGGEALVMELQNGKEPALFYSGATRTALISAKIRLGYEPDYITVGVDSRNRLVQIEK